MNPLSLLTKGRTIRGLKAGAGPYKLGKSMLPNFSGPKSPVPTTTHAELFPEAAKDVQPPPAEQSQPVQAVPATGTEGGQSLPETAAGTAASQASPLAALAKWLRSWMSWPRGRRSHSPAVQTELALDKVKVMRNDLLNEDTAAAPLEKKAGKKAVHQQAEKLTANP